MVDAIDDVTSNRLGANSAAKKNGVPPSTLKDRLSGQVVHGSKPGPKSYLSAAKEQGWQGI